RAQHKLRTVEGEGDIQDIFRRICEIVDTEIRPLETKVIAIETGREYRSDALTLISGGKVERREFAGDSQKAAQKEVAKKKVVKKKAAQKKVSKKKLVKKEAAQKKVAKKKVVKKKAVQKEVAKKKVVKKKIVVRKSASKKRTRKG
ncbi:MAG: hypothetical protein VX275_12620, partial [Pseudomonadota bacterium]|nr:hypothetical protein [Pseudomonadota bacterium]